MANFIQETVAAAQARAEAAEKEAQRRATEYAQAEREMVLNKAALASEQDKKDALRARARNIFQETGIKQALEAIAHRKIELSDVYETGEPSAKCWFGEDNGWWNIVTTTFLKDGSLLIKGASAQTLTARDLENNDIVSYALERAVKNPHRRAPREMPDSTDGGPNNVVGGKY